MAKRKKSQAKKTKRQSIPRSTRKFQLRKDHVVDQHVAEILDFARSQRREVTMIRDGVRLLWALQNDDRSVLYEMFPHMKPKADGGGDADLQQIRSMLEIVVAGRKTGELVMQSALPAPQKPTAAPPMVNVKQSTVSASDIADNFLSAFQ